MYHNSSWQSLEKTLFLITNSLWSLWRNYIISGNYRNRFILNSSYNLRYYVLIILNWYLLCIFISKIMVCVYRHANNTFVNIHYIHCIRSLLWIFAFNFIWFLIVFFTSFQVLWLKSGCLYFLFRYFSNNQMIMNDPA